MAHYAVYHVNIHTTQQRAINIAEESAAPIEQVSPEQYDFFHMLHVHKVIQKRCKVIHAKTFYEVNRQIPVYVPDAVVEDYKNDPYWKEFFIQAESKAPTAVDNIQSSIANGQKIFRDDQLLIICDGKTYNVMGIEIK